MRPLVRRGLAGAVLLAGAVAGCGSPSADLFVLERTGAAPGAHLTLLVNDAGTVRCDGSSPRPLPDPDLIQARSLQTDLSTAFTASRRLAPGPASVFSYRVRFVNGTVSYSDDSPGAPKVLDRLAFFAHTVARDVCRLPGA